MKVIYDLCEKKARNPSDKGLSCFIQVKVDQF